MAAPRKPAKSTPPLAKPILAPTPTPAAPAAPVIERSEVKGSGKPKVSAPAATRLPSHDEIKARAFQIYASRGYAPGDQNADWLEAERQLKAGL